MGHDIIINGVPISEDALREMMAMLERQNTSDGDEPGSCIQSENFEWVIDDDGDIVIKRMWRCWRWIDVENVEEEETGKTLTAEEKAERWEELKKKWADLAESMAALDRRISWAHFVLHNPRATEEQRQRAQEIMDSIPDDEDEEDIADDHIN